MIYSEKDVIYGEFGLTYEEWLNSLETPNMTFEVRTKDFPTLLQLVCDLRKFKVTINMNDREQRHDVYVTIPNAGYYMMLMDILCSTTYIQGIIKGVDGPNPEPKAEYIRPSASLTALKMSEE